MLWKEAKRRQPHVRCFELRHILPTGMLHAAIEVMNTSGQRKSPQRLRSAVPAAFRRKLEKVFSAAVSANNL